jgi:hypothetical protein
MEENGSNGKGEHEVVGMQLPHITISITDLGNFKLHISGVFPSIDFALNMLDQARRELDAQWRLLRLQQQQQAIADQALKAAVGRDPRLRS